MARVFSRTQGKFIDSPDTGGGMGGMQQMGGLGAGSQPDYHRAALLDLLTTGGKNVSKISAVSALAPKQPESSAADKKRMNILNQAAPVLGRIISTSLSAPAGAEGAFKAKIGKIPGVTGGEAEYLARDVEGFARLIASAFASEVGVATDKDVARWKAIMPQPGDTMAERVRQSKQLVDQITSESQSLGMEVPKDIIEVAKLLPQGMAGQSGQMQQPDQGQNVLMKLLQGQALPVAGATIGGLSGGLLGPVTGIAGAGVGATGGDVIRKSLLDLINGRMVQSTPQEAVPQALGDIGRTTAKGAAAAATEGIGILGGKLLGKGIDVVAPKLRGDKLIQKGLTKVKGKISGSQLAKDIAGWASSSKLPAYMKARAGKLAEVAIDNFDNIKITPQDAVDMFLEHSGGFTRGGIKKTATAAAYDRIVRKSLREQLIKLGGDDILKGITQIAKSGKLSSRVKGMAGMAALGAGVGVPISVAISKLLGIKRGD